MVKSWGIPRLFDVPDQQFEIQPRPPGKLRLRLRPNRLAVLYARHEGTTRQFWLELKLPFSSGIVIPHEMGRNQTL